MHQRMFEEIEYDITDNLCKWCGDKLGHEDDSSSECRFCNASPRNLDGSPVIHNENDSIQCAGN